MIDWKRHALNLAEVCDRYGKDRMHNDSILLRRIGKELIALKKLEDKEQIAKNEWQFNQDKNKRVDLHNAYIEAVRATNEKSAEIQYN